MSYIDLKVLDKVEWFRKQTFEVLSGTGLTAEESFKVATLIAEKLVKNGAKIDPQRLRR